MSRAAAQCEHAEGAGHDCAYVDWRNTLLDAAQGVADAEAGPEPALPGRAAAAIWRDRWDAAYHRAMVRLAADPKWRRGERGAA